MAWLQLHWTCRAADADAACEWLERHGAVSVSMEDAANSPVYEPPLGATPVWPQTRVTALFDAAWEMRGLKAGLRAAFPANDAPVGVETLQDRVWEREWLERFRPMRFGERLWVCPGGLAPPDGAPSPVVVELDPGLAFGTGTHPTTALCLRWLDAQPLAGAHCIDYGCGSGVLAIAAMKLGAARATAVDVDPQALTATRDNAVRNRVGASIAVRYPDELGRLAGPASGEIVLANILAGTLQSLAERLAALTVPGGALALSGVLEVQAAEVVSAYAQWFETREILTQSEEGGGPDDTHPGQSWALISLKRKK